MYLYRMGGLQIQSDFALPGVQVVHKQAEHSTLRIHLDSGPAPLSGKLMFSWPGRYGLRLYSVQDQWLYTSAEDGSFLLTADARDLYCFCPPASGEDGPVTAGMLHVLLRRVLPRVLQWHGRIAFHGASLEMDNGQAILFLGASGAGKSTLSVGLSKCMQWSILSDDLSLIDPSTETAQCFSVVGGASLWPDSMLSLTEGDVEGITLPGHDEKCSYVTPLPVNIDAAPLAAIVFLEQTNGSEIVLQPMDQLAGLMRAMQQLVRFNPTDGAESAPMFFPALGKVLSATPVYTLSYPRRYDIFPEVASALRSELACCSDSMKH